jgi:hypothetical protein
MSDTPGDTPGDWLGLLGQLQQAVAQQATALQRQDFETMSIAGKKVDELLHTAGRQLPVPPGQCQELLRQIQDQHRRSRLQLAQQKEATADELAKLRRGRTALRAYGGN